MPNSYNKNLIGKQDLFLDDNGVNVSFSRGTSTGGSLNIDGLNASHLPLLLATRTLGLYDNLNLDASQVDEAITQICSSLASIHKFTNQSILDGIQSSGSGAVITTDERDKLNAITATNSGKIITDSERNKLNSIIGLTQEQIDAITSVQNILPVGSIIGFPVATPPTGFLECNGLAVSRVTYSDLFGLLGTTYGVGDGSTTFNLPDYRGRFLRGWDHGATNDPDAVSRTDRGDGVTGDNIGTLQADEFGRHDHLMANIDQNDNNSNTTLTASNHLTQRGGNIGNNTDYVLSGTNTDPTLGLTSSEGGNETRPLNINTMWCIRYAVA